MLSDGCWNMFTSSTQKHHWTFASSETLKEYRRKAVEKYRDRFSVVEGPKTGLLTVDEEVQLCQLVADTALKFCKVFEPAMPAAVIWTGFTYFKRFYLRCSAMEFMPKNTMMGCLYLACKIEEFNVSVDEFIRNLKSGTPEGNRETVLNLEPIIMEKLDFHLTVHGPFRPLEGHLIDLKTNYGTLRDPERLRPGCQEFLHRALYGDACLLFPPSQISAAAVFYSAKKIGENLEPYVREVLVTEDVEKAEKLMQKMEEIIETVNSAESPAPEVAARLQERARECVQVIAELEERRKLMGLSGRKKRGSSQSEKEGKKSRRNLEQNEIQESD